MRAHHEQPVSAPPCAAPHGRRAGEAVAMMLVWRAGLVVLALTVSVIVASAAIDLWSIAQRALSL